MTIHQSINEQPEQRTAVEVAADKFHAAFSFFGSHAENAPQAMNDAMGGVLDGLLWEAIEAPATTFADLNRKFTVANSYCLFDNIPNPGESRRLSDALRRDLDRFFPVV